MSVHQPVVSGTFYPADAAALGRTVTGLLDAAPGVDAPSPKALILPHAGYRFSGAVAATAVKALGPEIRRVVLLGPSHRHAFRGVAVPDVDAMATPLGEMPLDRAAIAGLLEHRDVHVVPEAFAAEHSIEVELPFLQTKLGALPIVPLVVGDVRQSRLAEILETLWGGNDTLIVISTDLTHFMTADQARTVDGLTAQKIELLESAGLTAREACGHRPLAAFLDCARRRGLRLTRTALTHSGAVTGDEARVVGYGAWMAHEQDMARLNTGHRREAIRVARQALISRARKGRAPAIDVTSFAPPLQSMAASFVTLTLEGRLRGCIGSLRAHRPLIEDVLLNAVKAGFEDPRFKPVTEEEIAAAEIEIAILSHPARMRFRDETDLLGQLRPGKDGLILRAGSKRGTFLPKVWESLETPEAFLNGLKVKAGLERDWWGPEASVERYVTEAFRARPAPPS